MASLPTRVTTKAAWSDRHMCVVAAAACAAIVIYGSLMPFDFRPQAASIRATGCSRSASPPVALGLPPIFS